MMTVTLKNFHADWCGPCKTQESILNNLKNEWGDRVNFEDIDVDNNSDIADSYQVRSLPTLVIENEQGVVERFVGVTQGEKINTAFEEAGVLEDQENITSSNSNTRVYDPDSNSNSLS